MSEHMNVRIIKRISVRMATMHDCHYHILAIKI